MRQYCVTVGEKISNALEENAAALLDKMCEGEPEQVRKIAWDMFVTKVAFANGKCDCFLLPPLDEC